MWNLSDNNDFFSLTLQNIINPYNVLYFLTKD